MDLSVSICLTSYSVRVKFVVLPDFQRPLFNNTYTEIFPLVVD